VHSLEDVKAVLENETSRNQLKQFDSFSQENGLKNFEEFLLMNIKYQNDQHQSS